MDNKKIFVLKKEDSVSKNYIQLFSHSFKEFNFSDLKKTISLNLIGNKT